MCRESDGIYIFNPNLNSISKILKREEKDIVDKYMNEDTIIFDRKNPCCFYTDKNNFYLAKCEINPNVIEALKFGDKQ